VQRPLPSMLMAIAWRFKVAVNASLVNWLPWSQRLDPVEGPFLVGLVAASDAAAVNSTFRSAVTEERFLPFAALSDRCVLRRLCRLACV